MALEILDAERLLNVVSAMLLIAFLWVLASVRREHIRVEYSVSWLLATGFLFVLSRWTSANHWLADVTGLGDAGLALLFVTGGVFVIVVYRLSILISGLRETNIKLTQRVAILELRLESLDEKAKGAARG